MFAAKIKKYKSLEGFLLIDYKVIIKWILIVQVEIYETAQRSKICFK